MSRLISFGCSFTYGQSLPDCTDPNDYWGWGENPSIYAWPNLLAQHLNIKCVNQSAPASSNVKIYDQILNFNFCPGDLVFIMWSQPERSMLFSETGDHYNFGPWMDTEITKKFYSVHSNHDCLQRSHHCIQHIELYLKSKNLFFKQSSIDYHYLARHSELVLPTEFLNIDVPYIVNTYGTSFDNSHPGIDSHEQICNELLKEIQL